MHILHIMAGKGLGGAETYSTDVMLSLHRAGVKQTIVMSDKAPRYAEMKAAGLTLVPSVLAFPFRPWQKFLLRRLIQKEQPSLIQCWMRRAASLMTPHPTPVIGWFGGYYAPKHFPHCTHFVGVTKDITAHMVEHGVAPDRATYIPTFPDITDLPPVDRTSLQTPPEAQVILALSRLHPKKGLDTLLTALQKLPDAFAWLAGDGPLRQDLEALARRLGVQDRVRFLGWRTDRAALLRAANVCVLPSRYEPFGTVILEAWAAKTPFVACASAGPAATVTDGKNGLLVPIDDAPALADALHRALTDAPLRAYLIANGFNTYENTFTREAVTKAWIAYYHKLLEPVAP